MRALFLATAMRNGILQGLLVFVLLGASCRFMGKRVVGNRNVETEGRSVSSATKIKVMGGMDVILDSGATLVRVEAESNILPYIITNVDDGWLEIRMKRNISITTHDPIKVYITTPNVYSVQIGGSGNVTGNKKFYSDKPIKIDIGGSGNVSLQVHAPKVDANIGGSGNIEVSGETRDVDVSIGGSGNFRGEDLKAENAKVKIAGQGDVTVFADVNLQANIVGHGDIKYRGNASVNKKVVGSGSVTKL